MLTLHPKLCMNVPAELTPWANGMPVAVINNLNYSFKTMYLISSSGLVFLSRRVFYESQIPP